MNQGILGYPGRIENIQGIAGEVRNLVIKANTGTPITKLDVSFDDCLVATQDGRVRSIGAQSLTANYAFVGKNGLDVGAAAGASWYYVWVIWNEWEAALLLSLSSTAPQIPAGFTHKGLVGESNYDGTTSLRGFILYFPGRKEFRMTGTGGLPARDVETVFTHRLGGTPGTVQCRMVNNSTEGNYSVGDELPLEFVTNDIATGGNPFNAAIDATTVRIVNGAAYDTAILQVLNKTTFALTTMTRAKWDYKVIASS